MGVWTSDQRRAGIGGDDVSTSTRSCRARPAQPRNARKGRAEPAALVSPGPHRLTLRVYYNDGTVVSSQREGNVDVIVQCG